jgi:hypothetical protein
MGGLASPPPASEFTDDLKDDKQPQYGGHDTAVTATTAVQSAEGSSILSYQGKFIDF